MGDADFRVEAEAMMSRNLQRRIFLRSLLLQAGWNYERMQNIGFAFSFEPWLRRLYPRARLRAAALRRHLGFFNTQPHMAGFVLGLAGRMEEELLSAGGDAGRIDTLKRAMASSLAGLGDALFWSTLKPLCAAGALAFGGALLWAGEPPWEAAAVGGAFYILVFNVPALWMRWQGLRLGYELGEGFVDVLRKMNWQRRMRRWRKGGLIISIALAAAPVFRMAGDASALRAYLAVLAAALAVKWLRVRALPAYGMMMAACLGLAFFGVPR